VHQSMLLCLSQVKKVCRSVRIVRSRTNCEMAQFTDRTGVRFVKMIYWRIVNLLCRSVNGCCLSLHQWMLSASLARNVCRSVRIIRSVKWLYGSYDSSKWFTDGEPTLPIRKVRQWQWVLLCLGQE
jgi:hypothetical protein